MKTECKRMTLLTLFIMDNFDNYIFNIHQRVYKGNRDRNNYKVTDNLYLKWQEGKIVEMFNLETRCGFESYLVNNQAMIRKIPLDRMVPLGFYFDISANIEKDLKQKLAPQIVEFYTQQSKTLSQHLELSFNQVIKELSL